MPRETQITLWDELDLFDEHPPASEVAPMLWSAEEERPTNSGPAAANGSTQPTSDRRTQLASLLGPAPVAIDDLVRTMHCPASEVRALLFELEVAGRLADMGATWWRSSPPEFGLEGSHGRGSFTLREFTAGCRNEWPSRALS